MTDLIQIETLTDAQAEELCELYQHEWWCKGRTLDDVRVMLEASSLIVAFAERETGRLVAFSRLLTDFSLRGMIYDVIVAKEWRSQQVGRRLVDAIVTHPRLQRIEYLWLCCAPDMVPFYEKWGFDVIADDRKWMMRVQRPGTAAIAKVTAHE